MFYTSNERDYYFLSNCVFISENKHDSKKKYRELYFFYLNFSIVHISTNIGSLNFFVDLGNIHVEGTVSQNLIS